MNTREDITSAVLEITGEYAAMHSDDLVVETSHSWESLGIEHGDKMMLAMDVEAEYNIEFTVDELDASPTVGDLINTTCQKLGIE